jgi:hypothetical protein
VLVHLCLSHTIRFRDARVYNKIVAILEHIVGYDSAQCKHSVWQVALSILSQSIKTIRKGTIRQRTLKCGLNCR